MGWRILADLDRLTEEGRFGSDRMGRLRSNGSLVHEPVGRGGGNRPKQGGAGSGGKAGRRDGGEADGGSGAGTPARKRRRQYGACQR